MRMTMSWKICSKNAWNISGLIPPKLSIRNKTFVFAICLFIWVLTFDSKFFKNKLPSHELI